MGKKLKPGDSITQISAREWNRHVDAADAWERYAATTRSGGSHDSNLVKVRNDSGEDRAKGDILEFDGLALDDLDGDIPMLWFTGGAPSLANAFGVLLRAVPDGEIDDCQVVGACLATVNVTDAGHSFAKVVAGEYVLQSASSGPIRILYKPTGTGELNCGVLLGGSGAIELHRGITDEAIAKGASGDVIRYAAGTDTPENPTEADEVHNDLAPVATGKVVLYVQLGDNFYLLNAEKVAKSVLLDMRIKTDDTQVEAQQVDVYVDSVATAAWDDKLPLTECEEEE